MMMKGNIYKGFITLLALLLLLQASLTMAHKGMDYTGSQIQYRHHADMMYHYGQIIPHQHNEEENTTHGDDNHAVHCCHGSANHSVLTRSFLGKLSNITLSTQRFYFSLNPYLNPDPQQILRPPING